MNGTATYTPPVGRDDEKITQLYQRGFSTRTIARKIGRSYHGTRNVISRLQKRNLLPRRSLMTYEEFYDDLAERIAQKLEQAVYNGTLLEDSDLTRFSPTRFHDVVLQVVREQLAADGLPILSQMAAKPQDSKNGNT